MAWGKNFVKLRREMVLSHVICRYLFAHRGSSRKSAENPQNMTSLVESAHIFIKWFRQKINFRKILSNMYGPFLQETVKQ